MNELIRQVALDLQAANIGTLGSDIYIEDMPDTAVDCLMIVSLPSPPPHEYVDTEYIVMDFWSRSAHNDKATAKLREVYNYLHRRYDWDTADWHVYWSRALGSIVDASRDAESSKLKRLSVQFICRNLNNIS